MIRILLALCLFLHACAADTASTDDSRAYLISSWGEGMALPWYQEFEQSSQGLRSAAEAFCANTGAPVEPVQEAWAVARKHWKRTEVLAFGPYKDEPLRVGPKVDFWPARPNSVEAILTGSSGVSQPDVAQMGAAAKGFPAIEYLLWSEVDGAWPERRCDYLRGLTQDLEIQAKTIREAWDPNYGDYIGAMLRSGSDGGAFPSLLAAAGEIPNRMAHTIANIRRDKLEGAESPFSLHAKEDIIANLNGIEILFEGTSTHPGTAQILGSAYATLVSDVRRAFTNAYGAVNAISGPLSIDSDTAEIEAADSALRALHTLLYKDVLNALGFVETFNDADGD